MNLRNQLEQRISQALTAAGAPEGAAALVGPSAKPEFGDYQANGVMAAAKALKTKPHDLAQNVLAHLDLSDLAESVEIAGPGFINITLKAKWLGDHLTAAADDERLTIEPAEAKQHVVIDYSSPNLAKEMHVGHLRSTIIGDAIARALEFLGHDVQRQNHVGDWGTQFGMLVAYLDLLEGQAQDPSKAMTRIVNLPDIEEFYRQAKKRFDDDPGFADVSREYVVKLQSGDPNIHKRWEEFTRLSWQHCVEVYRRLGVDDFMPEEVRGESFYNDKLSGIVKKLEDKDLIEVSEGAQCVFLPAFANKDGEITPFIVQKTDGGYLYATTDLAAIRHRIGDLGGDRLIYVVGSEQSFHFQQLFAVAREAGFAPDNVSLEYVPFGMMLGEDRKRFRTREGGTIKLMDLLDEAVKRAAELVAQKNPDLDEAERAEVARVVGVGAVKYADLSQNRASDYVFSWDKMLSLEGNTAPYMQYAYARVRSIFRKGELDDVAGPIILAEPAERALGVKLLQLAETLDAVAAECLPSVLCAYLFELAGAFMSFYESCPVLKSEGAVRASRLRLCDLTARTIRLALGLLGIETVERM